DEGPQTCSAAFSLLSCWFGLVWLEMSCPLVGAGCRLPGALAVARVFLGLSVCAGGLLVGAGCLCGARCGSSSAGVLVRRFWVVGGLFIWLGAAVLSGLSSVAPSAG